MSNQDYIYAAVSFFIMPPLVSFLSGRNASGAVKALILSVLSILTGVAIALINGNFQSGEAAKNILLVIVPAISSYKFLLKDFSDVFLNVGPQLGARKENPASIENPS